MQFLYAHNPLAAGIIAAIILVIALYFSEWLAGKIEQKFRSKSSDKKRDSNRDRIILVFLLLVSVGCFGQKDKFCLRITPEPDHNGWSRIYFSNDGFKNETKVIKTAFDLTNYPNVDGKVYVCYQDHWFTSPEEAEEWARGLTSYLVCIQNNKDAIKERDRLLAYYKKNPPRKEPPKIYKSKTICPDCKQ